MIKFSVNPVAFNVQRLKVFLGCIIFCVVSNLSLAQTCECNEYIYLNEPAGQVHKYLVTPGTGALVEIGPPAWYGGSELPSPHGLTVDLNGNVIIGEDFRGGDLRKLTCDGMIFPEGNGPGEFNIPTTGQFNLAAGPGLIYVNERSTSGYINAYDDCDGNLVGSVTFCEGASNGTDWGYYRDPRTGMHYATAGFTGSVNYLWIFTDADFMAGGCISAANSSDAGNLPTGDMRGVVTDDEGNIYIAMQDSPNNSGPNSFLLKLDPTGANIIGQSANDTAEDGTGFRKIIGLVYSETTDIIYASTESPNEPCIAAFSKDLVNIFDAVPPVPGGNNAKGIAITTECCPMVAMTQVDTTICAQVGDQFFIADLITDCNVCEGGDWTPVGAGITFDPCDNSFVLDAVATTCIEFTKSSDGSSPNSICGAFEFVLRVDFATVVAATISSDQTICASEDPAPLVSDVAATGTPSLTLQWQESLDGCDGTFMDIPGATSDSYDPPVAFETKYYRLIANADGDCSPAASGICSDTSNCVVVMIDDCDHDVALSKVLTSPMTSVSVSDPVTFTITVENQGEVPVDSIEITDYINDGYEMTGTPAGSSGTSTWSPIAGGLSTITLTTTAGSTGFPIPPGGNATVDITLIVAAGANAQNTVNLAEISGSRDLAGKTGDDDIDSTPDQIPDNDPGADASSPDSPADGELNGDGSGAPDDGDPMGDEDDADPASIPVFDLALNKTIDAASEPMDGTYDAGDPITYNITVFNQGTIDAANVVVTDTFPCGFEYTTNNGWTGTGPVLMQTIPMIPAGGMVNLQLELVLKSSGDIATDCAGVDPNLWYRNYSYIESADDASDPMNLVPGNDIDSDPGSNTPNEQNTFPSQSGDNDLLSTGDGEVGSQDDHDPAAITVFDLALTKMLNPVNNPYTTGDIAEFEICVTNQNMIYTDSIGIVDYIPSGYTYLDNAFNQGQGTSGWDYDMATGQATLAIESFPTGDSLGFMEMVCVSIQLEVQVEDDYVNVAEINSATGIVDILGPGAMPGETVVVGQMKSTLTSDNDGQFDNDPTNDAGGAVGTGSDDVVDGNGMGMPGEEDPSTDSDESDPATIEIAYLSLGNQVWEDSNNNGMVDPGEDPIEGVAVVLHFFDPETMMCEIVDTVFTDMDGLYLFDSLGAGDYIVEIPAENFDMGGPLEMLTSSTGGGSDLTSGPNEDDIAAIDPDDNTNVIDHGVTNGNPMFPVGSVASDTITLVPGGAPLNEGDGEGDDGDGGSVTDDANNNLTVDFGFVPLHTIGNQVWEDANNNGILDDGEMLLEGVDVILHYVLPDGTCVAVDTIATGADGTYLFDSLAAGQYIVELAATNFEMGGAFENYVSSTGGGLDLVMGPNEDAANPIATDMTSPNTEDHGVAGLPGFPGIASDTIDLGNDEPLMEDADDNDDGVDDSGAADANSNLTIDFGLVPLHSIGNQVWTDLNNNGVFDEGEMGTEGVTVVLHQVVVDPMTGLSMCVIVETLMTGPDGVYLFDSLPAGDYIIEIPASNFDPMGPLEGTLSSTGGGPNLTDTDVFEDPDNPIDPDSDINVDDNGILDGNAMFPGSVVSDTLSLGNGEPENEGINPNDDGVDDSGAADMNSNLTVDFGFVPMHSVGNVVWEDTNNNGVFDPGEMPVEGVEVVLHYADPNNPGTCIVVETLTTDMNGQYLFDSLPAGQYIVELTAANFMMGGPFEDYVSSTGGGADLTSGPNEDPDAPIQPEGNTDNDDNGILDLNPMFPGSIVSDTLDLGMGDEAVGEEPGFDTSGALDENSNLTVDFGIVPLHSIGNQVWKDSNNNGIYDMGEPLLENVDVILHYVLDDGTCVIVDTLMTMADGTYLFDSLAPGQYIVELAASNFEMGGAFENYVSSTGGDSDLMNGPNEDPANPIATDDTSPNTTDHGIAGLPGFPGIASDTIDLGLDMMDEPVDESDDPLDDGIDDSGATDENSNLTIDFGLVPLHTIGNQVWDDANNNGMIDPGEEFIEGVEVVLHYVEDDGTCSIVETLFTMADGTYLFDSLPAGDYIVEIPASNFDPGGALESFASSTGGGENLVDVDIYEDPDNQLDPDLNMNIDDNGVLDGNAMFPGSVVSDTLSLGDDEALMEEADATDDGVDDSGALDNNSNLTVDFGFVALHSVGNVVWEDANNNGIFDDGEMPIENVVVELHIVDPNDPTMCILVETLMTDMDGKYLFDSLIAGQYIVVLTADNFMMGNPLEGAVSSTGGGPDLFSTDTYEDPDNPVQPEDNVDNDDNGILDGNVNFPGAIVSDTLDLGGMDEAAGEDDGFDMSGAADGNSNLTVDFGIVPLHSLGNQVWIDLDNSGTIDPGEVGVDGVEVVLHFVDPVTGLCVAVDTVTTMMGGFYLFDSLAAGDYIVEIPMSNYDEDTDPLYGLISSTGGGPSGITPGPNEDPANLIDPDDDANLDDNGVLDGNPMFAGSVVSDTVSLGGMPDEPLLEGDNAEDMDNDMSGALDENSNLTVDFGFTPLMSLGNQVWEDANNNGILDPGEMGIDGIEVVLHYYNPVTGLCEIVETVTTMDGGYYLFDSLTVGDYLVELPATNFAPGAPGEGLVSSTGGDSDLTGGPYEDDITALDPDVVMDNLDDNGVLDGNPMFPGAIVSDTVTLEFMGEPTGEAMDADDDGVDDSGAADNNSNLTVDFGLVALHSIGNLVWIDENYDGIYDDGEMLVDGVAVTLHWVNPATGLCEVVDMTTTMGGGLYLFDSLAMGQYIVEIDNSNFLPGGILEDYISSTGTFNNGGPYEDMMMPFDADSDVEDDDNGVFGLLNFEMSVSSDTITLGGATDEPTGEDEDNDMSGATDANSNLTIDFGFIEKVFDLALTKEFEDPMAAYEPGDAVPVIFVITNQGNLDATNIPVVDSIPLVIQSAANAGLQIADPDYTITFPSLDRAEVLYTGVIAAGTSDTVTIYFELQDIMSSDIEDYINLAEISGAPGAQTSGGIINPGDETDIDSTPDDNVGNDPGNEPNGFDDDNIDPDTGVGEDDSDPLLIQFCRQLSCRAQVNTSLPADCELEITANMLLTGEFPGGAAYTVTLDNGLDPVVDGSDVGRTFKYTVMDPLACGAGSCWGYITIEDKLPPVITCNPLEEISCSEFDTYVWPAPLVEECSSFTINSVDRRVNDACVADTIFRIYTARDEDGRTASCTDTLVLLPEDLEDLTLPSFYDGLGDRTITINGSDYMISDMGTLGCDEENITWTALDNGNPNPQDKLVGDILVPGTGVPGGVGGCGTINTGFSDQRIAVCGLNCEETNPSFKVVRQWKILDWCSGEVLEYNQIIKIADTIPPVIVGLPDVTISTGLWDCGAQYTLPSATATDNCSSEISVNYDASEGTISNGLLLLADNAKTMPGDEVEVYVTYSDCCGNATVDTFLITVADQVPPSVVADQHTVVSLSEFDAGSGQAGLAKIFAESFDNGSTDNCGPVDFSVRRMYMPGEENACIGSSVLEGDFLLEDGDDVETDGFDDLWFDFVHFCCEDVGEPVMVVFRVCDDANMDGIFGNEGDYCNTAMIEVEVQDKLAPACSVPADATINCIDAAAFMDLVNAGPITNDADIARIAGAFGAANGAATCNVDVVESLTSNEDCGVGLVTRTVTVTNSINKLSSVCTQQIMITADPDINFLTCTDISFPAGSPERLADYDWCETNPFNIGDDVDEGENFPAIQVFDCSDVNITAPIIDIDNLCSEVGINLTLDTFNFAGGGCKKILAHWEIIDQCLFDENYVYDNGSTQEVNPYVAQNGYFEIYVEYDLFDTEGPEITCGSDQIVDCGQTLTGPLTATATDDCTTDPDFFGWTWELDVNADGTVDASGEGNSVMPSDVGLEAFPEGSHIIRWSVSDGCGNTTTMDCPFGLAVEDNKEPTPYCFDGLSTAVMEVGGVTLWAADFDAGSFDGCGDVFVTIVPESEVSGLSDEVAYGLSLNEVFNVETGNMEYGWTFGCGYIPNGVSAAIDVRMYATDESGNYDYCTASLRLQDNLGACEDEDGLTAMLGGKIATEDGLPVEGVEVELMTDNANFPKYSVTDQDGNYSFEANPMYYDYALTSTKDVDYLNGVTTLDLVLIQKHILGIETIMSPYLLIAADINNDGSVKASDLLQLRKLILGQYENDDLPSNDSWRFVAKENTFADESQPWDYDQVVDVSDLESDMLSGDFMAVKIGDINASVVLSGKPTSEVRSDDKFIMKVEDRAYEAGDMVELRFTSDNFLEVFGYQFTLNYGEGLSFVGVETGAIELSEANFGLSRIEEGMITTSFDNVEGASKGEDEVLFTMRFRATKTLLSLRGEVSIGSEFTPAEAYIGRDLNIQKVELGFRNSLGSEYLFALAQNLPNPFNKTTMIEYNLPADDEVLFTIQNSIGEKVFERRLNGVQGSNEIKLDRKQVNAAGIYYYTIRSGDHTATRKMIVVN